MIYPHKVTSEPKENLNLRAITFLCWESGGAICPEGTNRIKVAVPSGGDCFFLHRALAGIHLPHGMQAAPISWGAQGSRLSLEPLGGKQLYWCLDSPQWNPSQTFDLQNCKIMFVFSRSEIVFILLPQVWLIIWLGRIPDWKSFSFSILRHCWFF